MKKLTYSYSSNYGYSYLEARGYIFAIIKIYWKYRKCNPSFELKEIRLGK